MYVLQNAALLIVTSILISTNSSSRSILDTIRENEQFTNFRSLLFRYYDALLLLQGNVTIFLPTNEAFSQFKGVLDEKVLLNHIVNRTLPLEVMDSRTRIVTQENYPSLWVTRGVDFLFVNNAQIDLKKSIYAGMATNITDITVQVIYVVDEVLAPVLLTPSNKPAKAIDFIHSRLHDFSHFLSAILDSDASSLYNTSNRNTYFVPINTRFSGLQKSRVDISVIKGHIVPYHALFTKPSAKNFPFPTIYQSSLNVVLSFFERDDKLFVECVTVRNGLTTSTTTIAEIIEANIPVDNGVVHVINTTLGILNRNIDIFPYLTMYYKISGDPSLSFSDTLAAKSGFYGILADTDVQLTFFVPRDKAWLTFSEKGKHVLEYCARIFFWKQIVVGETAYTMRDLELLSQTSDITLHSLGGVISFKVKKIDDDYYLVWNNKTIRVYRSDYPCVNGFVHIVDDPFLTQCDLISCRKQYAAHLRRVTKTWY